MYPPPEHPNIVEVELKDMRKYIYFTGHLSAKIRIFLFSITHLNLNIQAHIPPAPTCDLDFDTSPHHPLGQVHPKYDVSY